MDLLKEGGEGRRGCKALLSAVKEREKERRSGCVGSFIGKLIGHSKRRLHITTIETAAPPCTALAIPVNHTLIQLLPPPRQVIPGKRILASIFNAITMMHSKIQCAY